MAAKLMRRRSVRVLIGLVVLLVLAVVLLPRLVPADRLRELVAQRIEQATGAQVTLGEASVAVFPRLRVVIGDGRIQGTGEALQRAAGVASSLESYDVGLDRLEVDVALWPLLKKRLETGAIRLVRPQIQVVTRAPAPAPAAPGSASAVGGGASHASEAAPVAMPWQLAVAGLEVRDGSLTWREAGSSKQVKLAGWQQEVRIDDLNGLLQRLTAFQSGSASGPAGGGEAGQAPRLDLQTRLGELALQGFGPHPLTLQDLQLSGALTAPPGGSDLALAVQSLTWKHLALNADLQLGSAAGGTSQLRGSWQLTPVALADLVPDLLTLSPPPSGQVEAWLAEQPVRGGRLVLAGQVALPWPLPPGTPPQELLAGLGLDGRLTDGRLALPGKQGELTLAAAVALDHGKVRVSELNLGMGGEALQAQGALSLPLPGVAGPLQADLKAQGDLASMQTLALAFAPPPAAGAGPLPRASGRLNLTMQADVKEPPPVTAREVWKQRLEAGRLPGISLKGEATDVVLSGEVPGAPWHLGTVTFASDLATATLNCRGLEHEAVAGGATVRLPKLFPEPQVVLDLQVQRLDVDKLVATFTPPEQNAELMPPRLPDRLLEAFVGAAWAAAPARTHAVPPGQKIPEKLEVVYEGQASQVTMQKARYDDVHLKGRLAGKVLAFDEVTARRATGQISGSGKIDYVQDPFGLLSFQAKAQDVPASALLAPYVPGVAPLWDGTVSADATGSCHMQDKAAVLQSLALDGEALSTNGKIMADKLLADISPYLGARQDLKTIKFRSFLQHFSVRDGRYHVEDLKLQGPDTDWMGDGWLGFDGSLDLALRVKLPAGFQPDLGSMSFLAQALRGEDGRIELALRLTGRATQPKVQLDLSEAKARFEEQAGDKVQDALKKGVKGLLDNVKRK